MQYLLLDFINMDNYNIYLKNTDDKSMTGVLEPNM